MPAKRREELQAELETLRQELANLKAAHCVCNCGAESGHTPESTYRLLFENHPQPLWIYDSQSLAFLAVNDAAVQLYGYSHTEFLKKTLRDIYSPDDIPALLQWTRNAELPPAHSWRHRKQDGTSIQVEIASHSLRYADRLARMEWITDITPRLQTEQALQEQETFYRILGEVVPDFVWRRDADGAPLFVNQRWTEYTGLAPGQADDIPTNVRYHPEDLPRLADTWLQAQATGEPYEVEFRFRRHDGVYRWFMARGVPVKDAQGRILQWVGTTTDIHERKQAEKELQEREALLRHIMSGARCLFWSADVHVDPNGKVRWDIHIPDEAAAQRFFPLDLAPGQRYENAWYQSRLPEDRERCDLFGAQEVLAGRSFSQEFRCRRKDGEIRWLHEDVQVEPVGPGRWRTIGVGIDVTEHKRVEERLRQTISGARCLVWHAQIQQIEDESAGDLKILEGDANLPDRPVQAHFLWDLKILNEELASEFLPVQMLPGQSFTDAWYQSVLPEHWEPMHLTSLHALQSRMPGYSNEFRCCMQDGSVRWLSEDVRLDELAPGLWQAVGICTDITERKDIEASLRQSEERFREMADNSPDIFWISDLDKAGVSYISPAYERIWGQSCQSLYDRPGSFLNSIHPEDREQAESIIRRQRNHDYIAEYRVIRPDGQVRWVQDRGFQIWNERGEVHRLAGIVTDITDRKQAEAQSAVFSDLGTQLSAANTPQEASRIIAEAAQVLLGWDACSFDLYSEETGAAKTVLTMDTIDGQRIDVPPGDDSDMPTPMMQKMLCEGAQLVLLQSTPAESGSQLDAAYPPLVSFGDKERPSASKMFVPARYNGRVVGMLSIQSYTPQAYNEESLALLQSLADHCGGALERFQIEEALRKSEEQYRLLFEANPQPMLIAEEETRRFLAVNDAAVDHYGYSREEFLELTIEDIRPAEDIPLLQEARAHRDPHFAHWGEWRHRKKDGSLIDVEIVVHSLKFEGRKARFVQIKDITQQKQAQAALAYERNLLRTVIDTIPHNIYVRDVTGHYVLNNQSHLHYLGASTPEEVVGKTPFDYFAPDLAASYLENDRKVLQSGIPKITREEVTRDRQDKIQWHSVSKVPLLDLSGKVGGIVCLTEDITERKLAEEALQQKAEELARSNADLEQFAYVASHDLQEPLRMVASFTQLLQKRYQGKLDADADEFIRYAVDGTVRMQALIKDLLAYSRVATRGKELEPTDCQQVLRVTLSNLKTTIEESEGTITCDSLPTVLADGSQLVQVFQNLIGNALKFRGERPPQIHIGAVRQGSEWEFSIRDNGIGIEEQYAERIFVIFQRLHIRDQYPGTGIGLAICKKIIERHKGRIWLVSQPGKGTTFFFTLPGGGLQQSGN